MSTATAIHVGDFEIAATGDQLDVEGQTPGRVETNGTSTVYEIDGPDDVRLTLHDITWSNGERDVRAVDRHRSPQRFDRLVHGLRLTVSDADDRCRVDLRQARMVDALWAKPRKATVAELSHPIGTPIDELLLSYGATAVGSRSELIDDTSTHRNSLCAIFPTDAHLVPVVAYTATRLAPVLHRVLA